MQFNLKEAVKDTRIPKAYIDEDGDLVIFDNSLPNQHMCLTTCGMVVYYDSGEAQKGLKSAQRLLYAGDTLTVTF
jgi:hypothetical protein